MAFLQIGLCPISVLCRRLSRLPTRDFSCRVPFLALYPTGHGSEPTVVRDAELRLVTISGLRQLSLDILCGSLTFHSTGPWLCSVTWNRETSNKSLSLRITSRSFTDNFTSLTIEIVQKPEAANSTEPLRGQDAF